METISKTVSSALTAAKEQPTPEPPVNIEEWAKWLGVETFKDHSIIAMVRACGSWCMRVKQRRSPGWLSMTGPSGVGKTHCAKRVFNYSASRFDWSALSFIHRPLYWPAFIRDLRSGLVGYDQIEEMTRWPVLFIDDIGAERDTTGFAAEQLNALLGQREKKWTIITSNLNLEQLAHIEPRIADRMIRGGNSFVELDTTSYALRGAK